MYTILLFVLAGLLVVIYLEYFHEDHDRLDSRGRSGSSKRRRNTNRS
jgi:hypothetical protein